MSLQVNPTAKDELKLRAAGMVLRIAVLFQTAEKASWIAGPPRSKPGEHLRMDTGNARDNLVYTPESPAEVVANGLECRVGYRMNAWYAPAWELKGSNERRIGLLEKLAEFQKSGILGDIAGSYSR